MKNYVGFVNDHSGSMSSLVHAAVKDYNANISATKNAASAEMLDTVVSVVGVSGHGVERQVTVSNPHVLKPLTSWKAAGGTPLYRGILDIINLHDTLPDIMKDDVSVLLMITTDGEATDTNLRQQLMTAIDQKTKTGRWTFVFRVPVGQRHSVQGLGVPSANIQEWDTSVEGMERSSVQTQAAMTQFYATRSAGAKGSNTFYTTTAAVDTSKLADISKKVSLYIVPDHQDGIMVRDFILTKRMEYLIGGAFYQLTKTEARVSPSKLLLIRDRKTGAVYAGTEARSMLGLDTVNNARIHPNHGNGNYDIFIQSESVNRKLVKGTGVLYWEEKGRPVTTADLQYLQPKAPVAPAVPVLPAAPATGKPTPSPIAKTAKSRINGNYVDGVPVQWFKTREQGRNFCRSTGKLLKDIELVVNNEVAPTGPNGERWFVYH